MAVNSGDGRDELYSPAVPQDLLTTVRDAGQLCSQIGPVVIASQIQLESGWNKKLVGTDGAEGISQVPPDKFEEFGEDENDNDKTSGLDPEDSIMAQGRYMCSLAKQIDTLLDTKQVKGDPLDLTLAAYDVGLDTIKEAKGIPDGSPANGYVTGVRSSFALYAGVMKPPEGEDYPTMSPAPMPSGSSIPTDGQ
ncbi:transglycosylase SLT domain-containing protein [Streptomyces sp. Inha503]|uniref:transglycosylase SLT domain-containing protein n=1 Tax=Streptomyces sp. Inha503 TaxID=3383314 RepID=UPI0039A094C3